MSLSTSRIAIGFPHEKRRGMPEEIEQDSKTGCTKTLIRKKNDPDGKAIESGLIRPRPA
jgi:hypothetical protein